MNNESLITDNKIRHDIKIYSNQNNRLLDLLLSFVWYNSLDGEVWKEIDGFNGFYFVSNYGRVLSLKNNGYKLMKPFVCGDGYLYLDLRKDNKDIKSRVHRLVAKAFIDNPDNKSIVHHKDRNRQNNVADNLAFVNSEEHTIEHRKLNQAKK